MAGAKKVKTGTDPVEYVKGLNAAARKKVYDFITGNNTGVGTKKGVKGTAAKTVKAKPAAKKKAAAKTPAKKPLGAVRPKLRPSSRKPKRLTDKDRKK